MIALIKICLQAFRALEQIEADLDAARIQTAALAALIAPATKMFQFDDGANAFELSSPILLQHLRNQVFSSFRFLQKLPVQ